eukprot:gene12010-14041_t
MPNVLPKGIETIHFGSTFNQPLQHVWLPAGLKTLTLEKDFEQSLLPGWLPDGLKTLTFGRYYNEPLQPGHLPSSLETLVFGYLFRQPIEPGQLPIGLKRLTFDEHYTHPFRVGSLPNGLVSLTFGRFFNQPLQPGHLPATLEHLKFGRGFQRPLVDTGVDPAYALSFVRGQKKDIDKAIRKEKKEKKDLRQRQDSNLRLRGDFLSREAHSDKAKQVLESLSKQTLEDMVIKTVVLAPLNKQLTAADISYQVTPDTRIKITGQLRLSTANVLFDIKDSNSLMGNEHSTMLTPDEMKSREIGLMDGEMKRKLNTKASKYTYTDDIVDVEVWDVVDVAQKKKSTSALQLTRGANAAGKEEEDSNTFTAPSASDVAALKKGGGSFRVHSLDAQTVDVMKNTHAVIFMIDPAKRWTLQYVEREIVKLPEDLFVLVITNFRDRTYSAAKDKNYVTSGDVEALCDTRANMRHIDSSMLNAYGLRAIVAFFNVPFLKMQRSALLQALDRNQIEYESATEEINLLVEQLNYDDHVGRIEQARLARESAPPQPTATPLRQSGGIGAPSPSQVSPNDNTNRSISWKWWILFSSWKVAPVAQVKAPAARPQTAITKVDDFDPNESVGEDDSFYDDKPAKSSNFFKKTPAAAAPATPASDSFYDDDDDGFNPLVAQDEGDDSDEDVQRFSTPAVKAQPPKVVPAKTVASSPKSVPPTTIKPVAIVSKPVAKPSKHETFDNDDDSDQDNPFVTKDEDSEDEPPKKTPTKPVAVSKPPISKPVATASSPKLSTTPSLSSQQL